MCSPDCLLFILAILFPPLAGMYSITPCPQHATIVLLLTRSVVWVKRGICSADSVINIALCILGFIPGLLHAFYIIAKYPDPYERMEYAPLDGGESGARYHRSQQRGYHPPPQPRAQLQPSSPRSPSTQPQQGYATFTQPAASESAEGSSQHPQQSPPSYENAVRGDHKIQHD